jgi:hypothetical protein
MEDFVRKILKTQGHRHREGARTMRSTIGRRRLLLLPAIAATALLAPLSSQALTAKPGPPIAATGNVGAVHGTSSMLLGIVQPRGLATTYYFQYGPTVAYGSQTASATLPASFTRVKVGVTVVGFRLGEHYRLVASNADGVRFGRDHTYAPKSKVLKIVLEKEKNAPPTPYGGTFVVRGTLTGPGNTLHKLVLEASPYPYLEPFAAVTAPVLPSGTGSFVLRVKHVTSNTQFRVVTVDPRPVLSGVVVARVAVKVTLKVHSSARKGFVRLYGTVTPSVVGAPVDFQLLKATRAHGRSESETRFSTQFVAKTKRGTLSVSRFSFITSIRRRGYYRAYVKLRKGALVSGTSNVIRLSAAPGGKQH